jgi:hypothetical protein
MERESGTREQTETAAAYMAKRARRGAGTRGWVGTARLSTKPAPNTQGTVSKLSIKKNLKKDVKTKQVRKKKDVNHLWSV